MVGFGAGQGLPGERPGGKVRWVLVARERRGGDGRPQQPGAGERARGVREELGVEQGQGGRCAERAGVWALERGEELDDAVEEAGER